MKTGFIGLGAMGAPMARNLQRHGMLHGVWNRTADKASALAAELSCVAAPTIAELAGACDALVSCVSADDDLLAVVSAALPALRPRSLFIDCSTVSADTAIRAAAMLAPRDVAFLDAPVSGGVEGARKATLAIMVGGNADAFERARPVLQCMGSTISYLVKDSGAGNITTRTISAEQIRAYRSTADAVSGDSATSDAVCRAYGGVSTYSASIGRFSSCGDNTLMAYRVGTWVRIGACSGGSQTLDGLVCSFAN